MHLRTAGLNVRKICSLQFSMHVIWDAFKIIHGFHFDRFDAVLEVLRQRYFAENFYYSEVGNAFLI